MQTYAHSFYAHHKATAAKRRGRAVRSFVLHVVVFTLAVVLIDWLVYGPAICNEMVRRLAQ